jgi:hypothetical protein
MAFCFYLFIKFIFLYINFKKIKNMVTSDKNFKFSLRADLIKTISSFTDNLSYESLEKLSSTPSNPTSVHDFTSHLSNVSITYSGFIRNLIIDQFSHTAAFLYCIDEKMFPIFYIHGSKNPYKVPHIDEDQTLTYAEYSPTMFDLTGSFSPRFLINFSSEDKIAGFLYNFETSIKSYFLGIKEYESTYKEVYNQFKEHIAITLAHTSVMTYQALIHTLNKIEPNYIFSHSDETKMYFKYKDSTILMPFPITNKGLYRSFQKNFRETNQKNIPTNEDFVKGILLYYNKIHMPLGENFNEQEPIDTIKYISLEHNIELSEKNIIVEAETSEKKDLEHENNTNVNEATKSNEADFLYAEFADTIADTNVNEISLRPVIEVKKENFSTNHEHKDIDTENHDTVNHNSILEDDYIFSTSLKE